MVRFVLAGALALTAVPALAQSEKEVSCGYQADVVGAIKQARLDGVKERELPAALSKDAPWPEKYNNIIPLLAPAIYEKKRADLKKEDLKGWWYQECLKLDQ
ncbi:hypothetical protein [uncultured Roseobacter sp.]|uniref:hypothetical protein n=1 Tax=uncultured Roseobacter sp. TaxID=114847 RepID=UPI002613BD5F|nr:hypothetical protein [uncultured Roseobacter sp.]